jgi:very-short-patch-repair endonuclease
MTKAEVILWSIIRRKQICNVQFYRQKPLGKYIVDFYCPSRNLVIEIDGGHHYEDGEIIDDDLQREKFLRTELRLKVLRFTNDDICKNLTSVVDKIIEELGQ